MISFKAEQFWSEEDGEMRTCTECGDRVPCRMHVLNIQTVVENDVPGSGFIEVARLCVPCYDANIEKYE